MSAERGCWNSTLAGIVAQPTQEPTLTTLRNLTSFGRSPVVALRTLAGLFEELEPVDLLLEEPVFTDRVEPAEYDLMTGRLNPFVLGDRVRQVYLRANRAKSSRF